MSIDRGTRDNFEDIPVDRNGLILKTDTVQQEPYIFKLLISNNINHELSLCMNEKYSRVPLETSIQIFLLWQGGNMLPIFVNFLFDLNKP